MRTQSAQSFPGKNPGRMAITPDDFEGIVASVTQFQRANVFWNQFGPDESFSRDFMNTFGAGTLGSNEFKRKTVGGSIGPLQFETRKFRQRAKDLWWK